MRSRPGRDESDRVAARVRAIVGGETEGSDEPLLPDADADADAGGSRWEQLAARMPVRIDPGRRAAIAVGLAVLVAALVTGFWLLSARPRTMSVQDAAPTVAGTPLVAPSTSRSGGTPSAAPSAARPTQVVVDVAGRVHRPGLYRLPPGSRVDDALKAAGGALRGVDLSSLNLAALLVDGQQIPVGRRGAAPLPGGAAASGSGPAGPGGSPAGGLVNLNTATLEQLEALPGIGPALAQRILDYRTEHGSFESVDKLDDVSGIGTVIFARLKPLVSV